MSLELLLVPAAIAAVGAWRARVGRDAATCAVQTRWRDNDVLMAALVDIGASSVTVEGGAVRAECDGMAVSFMRRDDDIVIAHFAADADPQRAVAIVEAVDDAYLRRVQDAVVERVRSRVDALGYTVVSESVDDDDTVTMIVNLE
jgi:hypothetical protein